MTKTYDRGGYTITVREIANGWYELSTMAFSMGEEYRQHQLLDHEPTDNDLDKFVSVVEICK